MRKILIFLLIATTIGCSDDDGGTDDNGNGSIANNLNLRTTGASAEELLRDQAYGKLEVELLFVNGARPQANSINNLKSFLQQRLNKPNGILFTERNITDATGENYTIEEIVELEKDNRSSFTRDDTIAVSVLFVDKPNERDEGNSVVLGTAYRNTSLVMYQSTIERFSGALGQPSRINLETTVYNHEFTHLLGLVNLGTPLQSAHEDGDNTNHCNVEGCLMFFQINGGNVLNMMNMSSIPQLDAQCLADLRANGGK